MEARFRNKRFEFATTLKLVRLEFYFVKISAVFCTFYCLVSSENDSCWLRFILLALAIVCQFVARFEEKLQSGEHARTLGQELRQRGRLFRRDDQWLKVKPSVER